MSVLAYGRILKRAKGPQPKVRGAAEGEDQLLTAVAALVPAELFVAHTAILTRTTTTDDKGVTSITEPALLGASLVGLLILALGLFVIGRGFTPKWDVGDRVRLFIPPLALLVWMGLVGTTSALTPWISALSFQGTPVSLTVPFVIAVILAVLLVAINKRFRPAA